MLMKQNVNNDVTKDSSKGLSLVDTSEITTSTSTRNLNNKGKDKGTLM